MPHIADLYQDRRSNWMKDEIFEVQKELDSQMMVLVPPPACFPTLLANRFPF